MPVAIFLSAMDNQLSRCGAACNLWGSLRVKRQTYSAWFSDEPLMERNQRRRRLMTDPMKKNRPERDCSLCKTLFHPVLVDAGCPDVCERCVDPRAADYRVHCRHGEGSNGRGGQHGHRQGNQRGNGILPVGADQRLWGVPHRLPSRGRVHRRAGGDRL